MLRSVCLAIALGWTAGAADTNMLVSTEWLASHLEDNDVVILHVGSQKDYEAGHIPGARLLTLAAISVTGENGLRLQLPEVDALKEAFGKLGVTDRSRIVVYAGTDSVQSATRAWFTLDYLGLSERASLLDGTLAAWRTEGRPVSTSAPAEVSTVFQVKSRPELVVTAEYLQANRGSIDLIDARTPEFYSGASAGMMPRAGRIPGARNVPFHTLFDASGKWKTPDELRRLMGSGKNVVTYCHIGQQATVPYFAARLLGMQPRLYDGSFQDWSMRSDLPVEADK